MSKRHDLSTCPGSWGMAATLLLAGLFYLYVWLLIEPRLVWHAQCPLFVTTLDFLGGFLGRPGGPVEYVSAFVAQSFNVSWAGALVITLTAGLICLATHGLLVRTAGRPIHPAASLVPAVLLLMLHGQYKHYAVTSVSLLAALGAVNVYVRVPVHGTLRRLEVFLVLSAVLYYVVGGMYVVYALVCGVYELAGRRRIAPGLLCLACTPMAPLVFSAFGSDVAVAEAFVPLLPSRGGVVVPLEALLSVPVMLHLGLAAFFPAAALVTALRRRRDEAASPAPRWTPRSLTVFLAAAAAVVFLSFNRDVKRQIEVDYRAQDGQWERVLREARALPPELYDTYVMHDVNRALHHSGELLSHMFTYPQRRGIPSVGLLPEEQTPLGYRKFTALCLEMGHVNFAQHYAHYALEIEGERPELLKVLVRVNVLVGRPEAARVFLASLAGHLLYGRWARERLERLDADPETAGDDVVRRVRPLMPVEDAGYGGFGGFSYRELLGQLLKANPRNRTAFEYLLAHCLLTGHLEQALQGIAHLDEFGYAEIPRHVEEAVVLYMGVHPDRRPELHGRQVSPETVERFRGFSRDLLSYRESVGAEKEHALRTLIERWGGTYFFHYTFAFSEPRPGWRMLRHPDVTTGATP